MTRQREHDARRIAQGWRRVPVWLDPETLEALADLRGHAKGWSDQEAVRRSIVATANAVRALPDAGRFYAQVKADTPNIVAALAE